MRQNYHRGEFERSDTNSPAGVSFMYTFLPAISHDMRTPYETRDAKVDTISDIKEILDTSYISWYDTLMPAQPKYRALPEQILQVCNYKRGLSVREVTEKIKRFYAGGGSPVSATVHRVCVQLVNEGELFVDDTGYRTYKDRKFSLKPFANSHPKSGIWQELMACLVILTLDPEDNARHIKSIVDEQISPTLNQMRLIIELVDNISQSPEIIAYLARTEERVKHNIEKLGEDIKQFESDFWNDRDSMGEYSIGPIQKEIP